MFLLFEDLTRDPQSALAGVQQFLGLPEAADAADPERSIVANEGGGRLFATRRVTELFRKLKSIPGVGLMARAVPERWRARAFSAMVASSWGRWLRRRHRQQMSPLSPEMRQRLLSLFEQPTRELEEFLGRDLSAWLR